MIKFKTCEVMQFLDYYDTNDIKVIEKRIKSLTNLKKYAFIIHDKDILDNGEPKRPHFHIVLTFSNATTSQVVANVMKVEEQYINKIRTTTKSALLYLVHRNEIQKFQYNVEDVKANFDYVDFCDGVRPKTDLNDIALKIDNGVIKAYNIFEYVTIQDYAQHKTYFERCFEYRQNKLRSIDRQMECLFICGASGTGKTTQAKLFAQQKGYSIYISSSGKNALDDYKGQDCIILDDLRDSTYTLTDFLKLTDNNTNSLVGCRFYNKSIAECKLLIVTSVKPIQEFYKIATEVEKEPQKQLFRRFQSYIELTQDYLTIYTYNEDLNIYTKFKRLKNPVSFMYQPKKAEQFAEDFIKLMGYESFEDNSLEEVSDIELPFPSIKLKK